MVGSFLFGIFNIATAVGKDLQTVLICRFFSGFMASSSFTVVPGVYADIFDNRFRGTANALFSVAVFCGPLLSPFIGGIIVVSGVAWRWTAYITAIMGFLSLLFQLISLEETYPPVVLVHKADRMRRETKNWAWHAKQEELELSLKKLWEQNLSRPIRMLFTEPIVLCLSVYVAFIYALLYLFLELYPAIFREVYGMRQGVAELTYFGMIVGQCIAGLLIVLDQPSYNKKLLASNNVPIPEWRLPFAMAGGIAFPVGLFWLSWTGYTGHIHWIVPTLSGLLTGFGILTIFQQCLNYLIDAYLKFAASAVAANTFLRSFLAAGSPLFANYMIKGLGVQWAGTLLGGVAVLLMPMPFLFYYKGPAIRAKSSFKTEKRVSEKGAV
jgi:MFS transporter, DHA1 family, multidrug resistance protein